MDRTDGRWTNNDEQSDATSTDRDHIGPRNCERSNEEDRTKPAVSGPSGPRLVSRVLVTWLELTVVGIAGGLFGATVGGPPGLIIYLITTLLTVGIVFYNVNELIKKWTQTT